jgi:hypothetical protein
MKVRIRFRARVRMIVRVRVRVRVMVRVRFRVRVWAFHPRKRVSLYYTSMRNSREEETPDRFRKCFLRVLTAMFAKVHAFYVFFSPIELGRKIRCDATRQDTIRSDRLAERYWSTEGM